MTTADELCPGQFLKAGECINKPTFTISDAWTEVIEGDKGDAVKGVVELSDCDRDWILNRTNTECIKAMFGLKLSDWQGKRVTLFQGTHDGEPALRVWGSPDLDKDLEVTVKLARKRPFKMTMHATGKKADASPRARELAKMLRESDNLGVLEDTGHEIELDIAAEKVSLQEGEHLRTGYLKRKKALEYAAASEGQ